MDNNSEDFKKEAERLILEKENQIPINNDGAVSINETSSGLGKISFTEHKTDETIIEQMGWIRVGLDILPSQGIFYPKGTEITIRAASVAEIRHWSTIDDEDFLSLNDALNRIVNKCCRIKFPTQIGSYKDLKEIDRFFIVFAIREFTFKKGENNLTTTFKCEKCGNSETKNITKEMISYYVPSPELQTRFSEEERCFHLKLANKKDEIRLYLPTLGVMSYITNYIRDKEQNRLEYDKAFIQWAPFLFPDWRVLNDSLYNKVLQDSYGWSIDKISVLNWFIDNMKKTVKVELVNICECGEEVTADLSFRGGFKSLFLISDIHSKLL